MTHGRIPPDSRVLDVEVSRKDQKMPRRRTALLTGGLTLVLVGVGTGGGIWWAHANTARNLAALTIELDDEVNTSRELANRLDNLLRLAETTHTESEGAVADEAILASLTTAYEKATTARDLLVLYADTPITVRDATTLVTRTRSGAQTADKAATNLLSAIKAAQASRHDNDRTTRRP